MAEYGLLLGLSSVNVACVVYVLYTFRNLFVEMKTWTQVKCVFVVHLTLCGLLQALLVAESASLYSGHLEEADQMVVQFTVGLGMLITFGMVLVDSIILTKCAVMSQFLTPQRLFWIRLLFWTGYSILGFIPFSYLILQYGLASTATLYDRVQIGASVAWGMITIAVDCLTNIWVWRSTIKIAQQQKKLSPRFLRLMNENQIITRLFLFLDIANTVIFAFTNIFPAYQKHINLFVAAVIAFHGASQLYSYLRVKNIVKELTLAGPVTSDDTGDGSHPEPIKLSNLATTPVKMQELETVRL
ncbi:hypothetical protein HDU91_007399 [Kappamyces sp. JEL0680]|nr:hypothetical protein HDU91_007399 [Kappamyces sp. JEL0680]